MKDISSKSIVKCNIYIQEKSYTDAVLVWNGENYPICVNAVFGTLNYIILSQKMHDAFENRPKCNFTVRKK